MDSNLNPDRRRLKNINSVHRQILPILFILPIKTPIGYNYLPIKSSMGKLGMYTFNYRHSWKYDSNLLYICPVRVNVFYFVLRNPTTRPGL